MRVASRDDVTAEQAVSASHAAEGLLRRVDLIRIGAQVLDHAGALAPVRLRSLDAIHLATAIALGTRLEAMVVYDLRLAAAARAAGLQVQAPSQEG